MAIITETKRLILREIELTDDQGMFDLDSDQDVHQYLAEPVVTNIEESREKIKNIRNQYITQRVGRWALIDKSTNQFLGWAGLKIEEPRNHHPERYYDVGYRLIKKFWGKGFATEAAKASIIYGFEKLNLTDIYADADTNNLASKRILEKIGLKYIQSFNDDGFTTDWYKISNPEKLNN